MMRLQADPCQCPTFAKRNKFRGALELCQNVTGTFLSYFLEFNQTTKRVHFSRDSIHHCVVAGGVGGNGLLEAKRETHPHPDIEVRLTRVIVGIVRPFGLLRRHVHCNVGGRRPRLPHLIPGIDRLVKLLLQQWVGLDLGWRRRPGGRGGADAVHGHRHPEDAAEHKRYNNPDNHCDVRVPLIAVVRDRLRCGVVRPAVPEAEVGAIGGGASGRE